MSKKGLDPSPFSLKKQLASLDGPFFIALNKKHGCWSLSLKAIKWLIKHKAVNVGITVHEMRTRKSIVKWVRYPEQTVDLYFHFDLEIFESYSKDPNFRDSLERFITDSWHFNQDYSMNFLRTHPDIIECIQTLREEASGVSADLQIEEIYPNFDVQVDDGFETLGDYRLEI